MNSRRYLVLAYTELALGIAWVFTPWRQAVAAVWLLSVLTQFRTEINNAKAEQAKEATRGDHGTD